MYEHECVYPRKTREEKKNVKHAAQASMHARVSGQTLNGFRWDVNMGLFDICGTLSVFLGGRRSLPAQPASELLLCSFLQLPVHIPHLPACVFVGQDKRRHNLELLLHVQYSKCYKIAVQRFPPWLLSHFFTRDERGTHFSAFWVNVSLKWFYMNSNTRFQGNRPS